MPASAWSRRSSVSSSCRRITKNARQVSRYLDEFRIQGKLKEGVPLGPEKGLIRVLMAERKLSPNVAEGHSIDDKILAVALEVQDRDKNTRCVFVTKDTWKGNLKGTAASGLAGADAKCQAAANAQSLGGTWVAWAMVHSSTRLPARHPAV